MLVLKNPGVKQTALIPNFPKSLDIGSVIPRTAPFDAPYILIPGPACVDAELPKLIIK